ncbi:ABC-type sugar transport system ATPase subunit [Bradyrhizobium sp. USDA 4451]
MADVRLESVSKAYGTIQILRNIDLTIVANSSCSSGHPGLASRRCCA